MAPVEPAEPEAPREAPPIPLPASAAAPTGPSAAIRWRIDRERGLVTRFGAPAAAPPPGELRLVLDDVLARIPTHCLQPGLHDPDLQLRFPSDELLAGIARGRATIPLSILAQRYPEIFRAPASPSGDVPVHLPLQKLLQQLGRARESAPPEASQSAAPPPMEKSTAERLLKPSLHGDLLGMGIPGKPAIAPVTDHPETLAPLSAAPPVVLAPRPAPIVSAEPIPDAKAEEPPLEKTESAPEAELPAPPSPTIPEEEIPASASAPEPEPPSAAPLPPTIPIPPPVPEPEPSIAAEPAPSSEIPVAESPGEPQVSRAELAAADEPAEAVAPTALYVKYSPFSSDLPRTPESAPPPPAAFFPEDTAPPPTQAPNVPSPNLAPPKSEPVAAEASIESPVAPPPAFGFRPPAASGPSVSVPPRITPPPLAIPTPPRDTNPSPSAPTESTPIESAVREPESEPPPVSPDTESHLRIAPHLAAVRPPSLRTFAGPNPAPAPEPEPPTAESLQPEPPPAGVRENPSPPVPVRKPEATAPEEPAFTPVEPAPTAPEPATAEEPLVATRVAFPPPAPTPPDFPLDLIEQEPLQAIFMTDELLDLPRISQLSAVLPGVSGCLIVAGESFAQGGERPAGLDARTLRELGAKLAATADAVHDSLRPERTFTIYGGKRALSIFARDTLCLCVVHGTRGFLPGVRERLTAVADTLARGLGEEPAGEATEDPALKDTPL